MRLQSAPRRRRTKKGKVGSITLHSPYPARHLSESRREEGRRGALALPPSIILVSGAEGEKEAGGHLPSQHPHPEGDEIVLSTRGEKEEGLQQRIRIFIHFL